MIERIKTEKGKIGIFAVGHATYWKQFDGLLDKILSYHNDLVKKIQSFGVDVIDYGMIDSNEKAFNVVPKLQGESVDVVFCNMATYATSSVFAPIIKAVNKPFVLVALQPKNALDYSKANTYMQLENDNICSVPEFTGVAFRMGRKINDVILGSLYDDEDADKCIKEWCKIAYVLHSLNGARLGLMGHVLESMYDMHADPTAVSSAFNLHIPLFEIDDLIREYNNVSDFEIVQKQELIKKEFYMPDPKTDPITSKLTDLDLFQAAKCSVALDKFREKYNLTGFAYYYEGEENSINRMVASSLIVGNSILNAQGVPMCGEFDIKTCIAMLIMDRLGIGGSFAEFHPFDFNENFILVGHDGPHHLTIAEGKPILRSLKKYHGKPGAGASVEFKIKEGPITLLGLTQTGDMKFKFVIGEGFSQPGPIPPTGNTNTRGFFEPSTKEFIKKWVMEGPTHHFALGIGHHAQTIKKLSDALGIESVIVK